MSPSSRAASPLSSLRALYPLAARAFLDRDFDTTQTHIDNALAILAQHDPALATQRRKWDMLRVTLHTTVHSQPAKSSNKFAALTQQSPQALVAAMHAQSVRLFTPATDKPSPVYLPPSVVVNLVLAALKLDCPNDARAIAEEWLAVQQYDALAPDAATEYEKVVQIYCLHVLTRLDEWDIAQDHLQSNHILTQDARRHLLKSLKSQRAAASQPRTTPPPPRPSSSASSTRASSPMSDSTVTPRRVPSPTPSTSSASTTSTRTARPSAASRLAVTSLAAAPIPTPSTPSASSQLTVTPRALTRTHAPRTSPSPSPSSSITHTPPTLSDYIDLLRPYIAKLASSRLALFILFILLPLFAGRWAQRRKTRTRDLISARELVNVFPADADPAQLARERLRGARSAWWRVLVDTVKMASGGLT
ncbi:hypothetical protein EXIGLDRAFT_766889 [Exidia glandulosa HHB12029]|uniref:Uncharacterized protein n=1 Tax=Exidia glandulosa HHB12029 TaxID=1314781 RepID=A0A165JEJ0_EXIGL|nr:hypothetical protein EXIGLDRAFT_766889 [Exidia glandulosa HHB12029]